MQRLLLRQNEINFNDSWLEWGMLYVFVIYALTWRQQGQNKWHNARVLDRSYPVPNFKTEFRPMPTDYSVRKQNEIIQPYPVASRKSAVGSGRYSHHPLHLNLIARQIGTRSRPNHTTAVRRRPPYSSWLRSRQLGRSGQAGCWSTCGLTTHQTWQYNKDEGTDDGSTVETTQDAQSYRQTVVSSSDVTT